MTETEKAVLQAITWSGLAAHTFGTGSTYHGKPTDPACRSLLREGLLRYVGPADDEAVWLAPTKKGRAVAAAISV